MANSWHQSKSNRGTQENLSDFGISQKKGKTVSEYAARVEIRKMKEIDQGLTSRGRSLSREEIDTFMKNYRAKKQP